MLTDWFRKAFKWFLDPVARFFARIGLSANALTIMGCLLNIGAGVVVATGQLRWGGVCLAIASGFDGVDGTLARQMGKPTKFGAFLDSALDRISEAAILLGLAWWYMQQPGQIEELLAYIAIVGSLMVSYARARAEGLGISCKEGLLTRVERCIVLITGLILGLTNYALWILAVGTIFTAVWRIICVYRQLGDEPL